MWTSGDGTFEDPWTMYCIINNSNGVLSVQGSYDHKGTYRVLPTQGFTPGFKINSISIEILE